MKVILRNVGGKRTCKVSAVDVSRAKSAVHLVV